MHNLHGSSLLPLIIFDHYTLLHLITLVFCSLVYKIHHPCKLGLQTKKEKKRKMKESNRSNLGLDAPLLFICKIS